MKLKSEGVTLNNIYLLILLVEFILSRFLAIGWIGIKAILVNSYLCLNGQGKRKEGFQQEEEINYGEKKNETRKKKE